MIYYFHLVARYFLSFYRLTNCDNRLPLRFLLTLIYDIDSLIKMTGGDWFSGNIASFETSGVNVIIKNTFILFKFIFMERHFLLIWFWPSLTDMYVSVDLMMILLLILKCNIFKFSVKSKWDRFTLNHNYKLFSNKKNSNWNYLW